MSDWWTSRWPTDAVSPYFAPEDIQGMTHQAERPNPVPSILDALKQFYQANMPDYNPIHLPETQPKDYLRELAQNPDILSRTIDQANAFNFGGVMKPIKGGGVRMGTPEFEDYPRAADVRSNMNDNLRFRDFERQQTALRNYVEPTPAITAYPAMVRSAAIRTPQGIFEGPNHASIIDMLARKYGDDIYKNIEDGFVTTTGKFIDRPEANKLALEQNQNLRPNVIPELFGSEDLRKPIIAFHGSPHDFDRFDLSRIGTGEARLDPNLPVSQRQVGAYGAGLYFAENPKVAEEYKNQFNRNPGSEADAKMYQVSIKADPEHFLDWDKPFNEQPQHVKDALRRAGNATGSNVPISMDAVLHDLASNLGGPKVVSDALREAGIPGIKYLDQQSRAMPISAKTPAEELAINAWQADPQKTIRSIRANYPGDKDAAAAIKLIEGGWTPPHTPEAPQPTRNFVLFDDKLIDIVKKYGLAGLLGPAAASYFPAPGAQPQ